MPAPRRAAGGCSGGGGGGGGGGACHGPWLLAPSRSARPPRVGGRPHYRAALWFAFEGQLPACAPAPSGRRRGARIGRHSWWVLVGSARPPPAPRVPFYPSGKAPIGGGPVPGNISAHARARAPGLHERRATEHAARPRRRTARSRPPPLGAARALGLAPAGGAPFAPPSLPLLCPLSVSPPDPRIPLSPAFPSHNHHQAS
ncbi:MAG: hypothetical protein J3K34DRAFT_430423 [Monoraphidium minutum]|nr:MAG: hypothetical protein J3K34DRAFT_430423 [Monoraphidium minutum]